MADDLGIEGEDPFSSFLTSGPSAPPPVTPVQQQALTQPEGDDPFAQFLSPDGASQGDGAGAFARGFERGVVPAVGGVVGGGMGIEIGAAAGAAIGAPFGGVGAVPGAIIGGFIGGIGGSIIGASSANTAQEYALDALPDDWVDAMGQSAEQRARDAKYHPTETFLGGLTPNLLTMKPGGFEKGIKLPANATAYQRILANPLTARLFGGAVMGGMELGTEVTSGESPDWAKVAIATGFGVVFNKPNRFGLKLNDMGADPIRQSALGKWSNRVVAEAEARRNPVFEPTVAQAADAKVMGPGITEEVFMGTHAQADEAAQTAQNNARTEAMVLGTDAVTEPDLHALVRRLEPETFSEYDALAAQRDDLKARLEQITSSDAAAVDTAEAAAIRQHILSADAQLRDLSPQVSAAYRRAADAAQGEVIEPEIAPAPAAVAPDAVPVAGDSTSNPEIAPAVAAQRPIEAQMAAIADDVERQLIAAGQPMAEAKANAQLLAHRYRTRAARLGNPLGAEALYRAEGAAIRGPQGRPPLIPTPEAPSIGRTIEERPAGGIPASELESLDPADIGVDAKRFQFKEGGDESGVTDRLSGVEKWDARLAGTALVFRDENGKNWIADGHQRLGLAKRLSAAGQPGVKLNAFVLDAKTGVTDSMARAIAAVKNIAEGTGSAVDAAKVLRAAKDSGIDLPPLPPRSALVRDGRALAELSPEAFGIVVNDVVPTSQGAIVGRLVKVPEQQVEALRLLATLKPDNVQQAEMIVRDMLSSGTMDGRQESLFGTEDYAASIVLERAKIADEAMKQLRRDKATFKTLIDEAERIQGAGANVLDQTTNQSRLTTDEQAAEFLKLLAFRAGPVSDALSRVARQLKTGEIKTGEAARTFLGDVRRAVEAGVVDGPDAGSSVAGAGDDLGPSLFQPAPPIDTPAFNRWFGESKVVDDSGAPLVVFHGSKSDISEFTPSKTGEFGAGIYFTEHPEVASGYASAAQGDVGRNLTPVYLALKNPLITTDKNLPRAAGIKKLKAQGYDGVIGTNANGERQYVAFDPTQIKSTANRGTFDPNDPRILFQPAYHGSPHIFDRFEWSDATRGKGEGAQAFGDGLYFAGNREVAKFYRDTLTGDTIEPAKRALGKAGGDVDAAITAARTEIDRLNALPLTKESGSDTRDQKVAAQLSTIQELTAFKDTGNWKSGRLYKVDIPDDSEMLDWDKPISESSPQVQEAFKSLGIEPPPMPEPIKSATLDIIVQKALKASDGDPRDIALTIDNDRRMYDQATRYAERVMGATAEQIDDAGGIGAYIEQQAKGYLDALKARQEFTGEKAYRALSEKMRAVPEEGAAGWASVGTASPGNDFSGDRAASAALREAGVPGHRFLDHGSRDSGEGTHNYVIYDDSRVNITEYEQGKRGSITFRENQKPLIKLFADSDASTFLHETGHQWLEELMRDAVHPQADDVVKTDAGTVRKWLGIGEDGKIATKQHEKFATGFEQYLREGVAPSPALARVFSQFKAWLTAIYQSIRGLGTPISDDIRQVFDRMIEMEPQRTVVAPEREGAGTMAGLHETEAEGAHPNESEPIGDRIVAERDAYLAEQSPEVLNELAAAEQAAAAVAAPVAGAEDRAGPAGGPAVLGAGGEPQSVPEGGIGSGERGAVLPSRPAGMGEGTGLSTGSGSAGLRDQRPGASDATGSKPQPLAPDATTLFGPEESPFLDKAGNIRVENLTSSEDVAKAIYDAAMENEDFIGDRRDVITDGQVLDLADALGMDAETLNKRKLGEAFNAESIIAARKLLIQSATNVSALMKRAAEGTDEDVMAYAQAKARHQMIQAQVAGITAEAGRALRAFRNIAGQEQALGIDQFLKTATGKTLFQLKEEAKLGSVLDTPAKVSKFMRDSEKPGFSNMVAEYWINGLVSGPKTHVTNLMGNVLLSVTKAGPDTAIAALIGAARKATGRQGETVRLGEVGAQMGAAVRALPSATKAALSAIRTGKSTLLPGETGTETNMLQLGDEFAPAAALDETATAKEVTGELFALVQGMTDGLVSIGKMIRAGGDKSAPFIGLRRSNLGAIPDIAIRGVPALPIGSAIRLPTRMLAAGDSFFRAVNYSMEKSAIAYRTASEEGLSGAAFNARIADIRSNPSMDVMEASRSEATDLTLMSRRSEFVKALSRLTNTKILGAPLLKFIAPFINTPSNIIEQTVVRRTPLGLFSPEVRADMMGKNGTVAQDTAMAKMLLGTSLSIGFGAMAAQGLASGSGPSDPQEMALWRLAGNQAHSVRIGDMWYQVNQLGPMGMLMGISADMYDVSHAASEGDLEKAGAELLQGFTQNILDASFMTGPSDLIEALQDPNRYGQQYIKNFLSSFVPYSGAMGQVARNMDPYSRQARDTVDSIKAKIPGLSEQLYPRRDIWGEPIPNRTAIGSTLITGIYTQKLSTDPVNIAMSQAGYWPGTVDRKIRGVELTDEQYDIYAATAGFMAKQNLNRIVASSAWQSFPTPVKHDIIQEAIRQSRETARGAMMARFPKIARDAVAAKLSKYDQQE